MAGVPQPESLRQRIADLLAQVEPLLEELEQAERIAAISPRHHQRPQLRLIKGGGAVIAVPLLWARDHTAQAAAAVLIGAVSGSAGLVGGSIMAPAPAGAEAKQQPYQSQPYEASEDFQAPRPASFLPPSDAGSAVPSPMATTPLPTGTPGPAPAQHDAMPNPTPLRGVASPLEPEPGLAPPTSTPTVTPTPTATPNAGLTRKAAVLECVGEPGGKPPTDLVACVDSLLAGS